MYVTYTTVGRDSSVGRTIGYGLDGPGIESRWRRDFPHLSTPVLGTTQPPVQWVPVISRDKVRPVRDAEPSPPSSAMVKKKSTAIPLLPLWAVRPVQSLSARTRVQFTFTYNKAFPLSDPDSRVIRTTPPRMTEGLLCLVQLSVTRKPISLVLALRNLLILSEQLRFICTIYKSVYSNQLQNISRNVLNWSHTETHQSRWAYFMQFSQRQHNIL